MSTHLTDVCPRRIILKEKNTRPNVPAGKEEEEEKEKEK